jgi:hypothetical protein
VATNQGGGFYFKRMKKFLLIAFVAAAWYVGFGETDGLHAPQTSTTANVEYAASPDEIQAAFDARRSGVQVQGEGVVAKILADDNDGSRHQRFILRLASGQTLLVAHNTDLAPRIDTLKTGDNVGFNGVYEWNAKGGVVHWTHHDPAGQHPGGWLMHAGKYYQ